MTSRKFLRANGHKAASHSASTKNGNGNGNGNGLMPHAPKAQKQIETALYIAELTAEMATMAGSEKLDILAYFLSMARVEAELVARQQHEP
jgi:hypothetical protein